jgi:hypothetical protein
MYSPQTVYLHESIETIEPEDFFDVLIIGGGKFIFFYHLTSFPFNAMRPVDVNS